MPLVAPPVRFFTPEEARLAVPRLRPVLAELRDAWHEYRFHKEQLDEMARIHGADSLDSRGHPEHDDAQRLRQAVDDHAARIERALAEARDLGAEVKDPLLGLVDFYARRADGEVVLLCWRDDEPELAFWHPLDTGFAGRRPLDEL